VWLRREWGRRREWVWERWTEKVYGWDILRGRMNGGVGLWDLVGEEGGWQGGCGGRREATVV
jgi:hypothetical protein